jgi:deoxyribonuclease (pyrimidine dimer)
MRCNVGINPKYLADQHLIAEYRELPMVLGSLRVNNYQIKTPPLMFFNLGKGHINWFKSRLVYLKNRHNTIKNEMSIRGFKNDGINFDIFNAPIQYQNNWVPTLHDSLLLRNRIKEKLLLKPTFYKYYGNPISNIILFIEQLIQSELFEF